MNALTNQPIENDRKKMENNKSHLNNSFDISFDQKAHISFFSSFCWFLSYNVSCSSQSHIVLLFVWYFEYLCKHSMPRNHYFVFIVFVSVHLLLFSLRFYLIESFWNGFYLLFLSSYSTFSFYFKSQFLLFDFIGFHKKWK